MASQLPIFLISVSESSKFMDDSSSTFYQGFLWAIAISHLLLPQRLDTLRLHQGTCDELRTTRSEATPRAEDPNLHETEWTQPMVETG
jgi:hypothetical protein